MRIVMRGKIIRTARKNKYPNLTILEFSKLAGLTPLTIQRIETGVIKSPTRKTKEILTRFLGINIRVLYSEQVEEHLDRIAALQDEIKKYENNITI